MSDFAIPKETLDQMEEIEILNAQREALERLEEEPEETLPEIKVTEDEITTFWDSMLKSAPYTEDFDIRGLTFTLKTRSAEEVYQNVERLDELSVSLNSTAQFFNDEAILVSSLARFGAKDLLKLDHNARLKFVRTLPAPISGVISNKLAEFDAKVFKMTEMVLEGNS
jgi:hypothetical protein